MILVSGFNVAPSEIETVLHMMAGVNEVGVCGVPDEHTGEAVKAVVVKKDPTLSEQQIIAHCTEYLTGYKIPKIIRFVDELPVSVFSKTLKRELAKI